MKPEPGEAVDQPPPASPSIWERLAKPSPVPRATVTCAGITATGVRIADDEDLAAVSMRRLAVELGVSAMALYRHVSGKDDVVELMLDSVRGEMIPTGDADGDWRAALRASAHRFRTVMLAHPWVGEVPGRILFAPSPNLLAGVEHDLAALDGLGLDVDTKTDITRAVAAYTRATTHDEIVRVQMMRQEGWTTLEELHATHRARMRALLRTGHYPAYEHYIAEGTRHDEAARFDFGLDCLLDGIAARLHIPG